MSHLTLCGCSSSIANIIAHFSVLTEASIIILCDPKSILYMKEQTKEQRINKMCFYSSRSATLFIKKAFMLSEMDSFI